MPLETQVVSLGFGPGVDTKTDPKASSKPIVLRDCVFTSSHRLSKRNGYDPLPLSVISGGVVQNPVMVKSYKNELVCAGTSSATSSNRLFSYSSSLGVWSDRGKYNSIAVSKRIISAPELNWINTSVPAQITGTTNPSGAYLNNIVLYGYDTAGPQANQTNNAPRNVYWAAYDNQSGGQVAGSIIPTGAAGTASGNYGYSYGWSKVVVLGSSRFAIFYVSDTSAIGKTAPKLCYRTITISAGGASLGSEVVLNTINSTSGFVYDVVNTSSGCFVALGNSSAVVLYTINSSGAVTHGPTTIVTSGNVSPINVVLDSAGTNAWAYWMDSGSTLKYAIYNATTLASVLAATTAQSGLSTITQVTAVPVSPTQQTLFTSQYIEPATSLDIGVFVTQIKQQAVDSSGTAGSAVVFKNGLDIWGKPFVFLGASYLPCICLSQNQPTGFIIDVSDALPVAKFLQTKAEGVYAQSGDPSGGAYTSPTFVAVRNPGFLNPVLTFSASQIGFASGFVVSLTTFAPVVTGSGGAFPVNQTSNAQMGVCLIGFDFNHIDANQSVVQQDTLALNGGFLCQYDGSTVSELGFHIDPDNVSIGVSGSPGALGTGSFTYFIVYRYTDANGNLHQSAPSVGATIVFQSGTTNGVKIGWSPLNLSQKNQVSVDIYRTIANGTTGYLLASFDNSSFGWGNSVQIYQDVSTSDALIQSNAQIYTAGGAILENIAPPPAMIMWENNNRLWCINSESPETNIEPSKTASTGSGISFSTDQLTYVIDSKGGDVSGASPMDEKTVILKKLGVGYFIGDAANDAGSGSTLSNFQFIPSDVGCSNSKSVILYPGGIIFRSSKGIYQISRGAQVSYFGYEVSSFSNQDIVSSLILSSKNQIRFLTSNGSSILFDYVMNQWSVFTNHSGLSSDSFNGLYVYARSGSNAQDNNILYIENTTSYLDNTNSISPYIQLQWVKGQSIQNYERLRKIILLGDYQNGSSSGHGVSVSAAYDFGSSFSSPVSYFFGQPSASGPFQYREGLPRQKCDAISLLIQEITTGASGEFIDFTDLGIELAVKRGLNKLPGSRSV